MKCEKSLQPNELRVVKLAKDAILNLSQEIIGEISRDKFNLPHSQYSIKRTAIDWYFDEERCQMILFAYSRADGLNREAVFAHIDTLSGEAIDSLLVNDSNNEFYQSTTNILPVTDYRNATNMRICRCGLDSIWKRISSIRKGKSRPLKKHEVRIIRLSQAAIKELLWEYFVETGDKAMNIPKEDKLDVIFHMSVDEKFEELMLYALNLNEFSQLDIEKVNAYCSQNIPPTANAYTKKPSQGWNYVSVMLTKLQSENKCTKY